MKLTPETKVGLVAAAAILIIIFGINFLKGKNLFNRSTTLYSWYDNADGLAASNPVIMHGVQVGQVDNVELTRRGEHNVLIQYHVEGRLNIPQNSVAKIISSDILGSKAIEIIIGDATVYAQKFDTLPGAREMGLTESISRVVAPVRDKVEHLITSVDTIVTGLHEIFDVNTRENLRSAFSSIQQTLSHLEHSTKEVDQFLGTETNRLHVIFSNIEEISTTLKENGPLITHAINNLAAISDTVRAMNLTQVVNETNQILARVNALVSKAESGDGTIARLLNDGTIARQLEQASKRLNFLVADLTANPGRYVNLSVIQIGGTRKGHVRTDTTFIGNPRK